MSVKFIADAMLGKLARYLRMFNIDILYFSDIDDNDLIENALIEKRIILTRDTLLIKRRYFKFNKYIFIEGNHIKKQLKSFNKVYTLQLTSVLKRCLECNTLLDYIDKNKVFKRVPKYVFETQDNFKICNKCNKIYWKGTHYYRMKDRLEGLLTSSTKRRTGESAKW